MLFSTILAVWDVVIILLIRSLIAFEFGMLPHSQRRASIQIDAAQFT
jgi:hypothetical protein